MALSNQSNRLASIEFYGELILHFQSADRLETPAGNELRANVYSKSVCLITLKHKLVIEILSE
jgi:hypothetical protein